MIVAHIAFLILVCAYGSVIKSIEGISSHACVVDLTPVGSGQSSSTFSCLIPGKGACDSCCIEGWFSSGTVLDVIESGKILSIITWN